MMYFASFSRLRSLPLSSYERFFAFQFRVFFFLVDVDVFDASRFLCFSLFFSSPSIRRHTDIPLQKNNFFSPFIIHFFLCIALSLCSYCGARQEGAIIHLFDANHTAKKGVYTCVLCCYKQVIVFFFLLFVHTRFKRRFSSTYLVDFRFVPLTRRKKHACAETTTLDAV